MPTIEKILKDTEGTPLGDYLAVAIPRGQKAQGETVDICEDLAAAFEWSKTAEGDEFWRLVTLRSYRDAWGMLGAEVHEEPTVDTVRLDIAARVCVGFGPINQYRGGFEKLVEDAYRVADLLIEGAAGER